MNELQTISDSDVLILGGGFAGVWCARRLERLLPRGATLTLVNADNYFVYQPLLPEVVGASLEPTHVVSPLRHLLRWTRVVRGEVVSLDPRGRLAEVAVPGRETPLRLRGRHVVLSLGSVVDVARIPGMAEHAFMMKNVADALSLRQALIERLERAVIETDTGERARLLSFVVVGGGFSGVETAAEILDFLRHAKRFYPQLRGEPARVVCVHAAETLLPELDPSLGRYAERLLARRGMQLRLQTFVRAVSGEGVYLQGGETIPAATVVCTVGNAPHPILSQLELPRERGWLLADEYLRVVDQSALWVIGDGARGPDGHGGHAPPTAQFAVRQGEHVARNLHRVLTDRHPLPFAYRSRGQLATLGHRNAVAYVGGLKFSGFFAWWLWRTLYLMMLPRLDRKLQVVIEWTLRLFFPRSLNAIDVRPTHAVPHAHLEAGEVLFRQGDPSVAFYVVEAGRIELSQLDAAGEVVLREELGPGQHFGEGSLMNRRVRTTTARALEPSKVLVLRSKLFDELARRWQLLRTALQSTSRRFAHSADLFPGTVSEPMLGMPASRLMTRPVTTLPATASLEQALRIFAERGFSCLPLVDDGGRLVGISTRSDLYRALQGDLDLTTPILACASCEGVRTVAPEEPAQRAIEILRRHGIQHVPVVDAERRVLGMISFRDLVRELIARRIGPSESGQLTPAENLKPAEPAVLAPR